MILKGEKEEADSEEKIVPLSRRFRHMRHTAVSRMLNVGTSIARVAMLAGCGGATMVLMARR
jgi:hypothetical protein